MEITLFTTDNCNLCRQAKALLDARGLTYVEVNLGRDNEQRELLAARTGRMTFPQVIVDGEPIGGHAELVKFVKQLATRTGRPDD